MSKAWCEKNRATKPQNFTAEGRHDHRAPGQRHRPLHAEVARARRQDGAGQESELVGHQGRALRRQRRRGDLHADRLRRDARRGADLGRSRPRQRSAAAGRAAAHADARHQGARRHREPHRVHRHGPGARRAPVLQRQGQEPVQGQARARRRCTRRSTSRRSRRRRCAACRSRRARCCRRRCRSTPELEKRLPFDKAKRAKKLLAEAGYPNGFEVTLDCPNNRYVNDEKICQALAAMWAQIGVKINVNAMPRANYFPKLEKTDTSMYMLGWGGGATDAHLHPAAGAVDATTARATATTTTAATPIRSSTS